MSGNSHRKSVAICALSIAVAAAGAGLYQHNRAAEVNARRQSTEPSARTSASPGGAAARRVTEDDPARATSTGVLSSGPDNDGVPLAENAAASVAAGKTQVCSLISRLEMEAILGRKVQQLVATAATCEYRTNAGQAVEIESTWKGGKDAMAAARIYNAGVFSLIPNLGDETYFQAAGIMHARKGDVYIVINARAYPNSRDVEIRVVERALDWM